MKLLTIIFTFTGFIISCQCHPTHDDCNGITCFDTDSTTTPVPEATPPIVLWHGIGDSCCNPLSMGAIKSFLEKSLPNVHVHALEIGSNIIADMENSYFKNCNDQVEVACQQIKNDSLLKDGYNALGFSQGGQFLRAVAQRCPDPPMLNLVSMGGQHQGVYGFPKCPGENATICNWVRKLLSYGAYNYFVQRLLVPAQYWHDSLNENDYQQKSIFLADVNNELVKNQTYKDNLTKLKNLILVKWSADTVVDPKESEWFGFYKPGQAKEIMTMKESPLYQEDWIGLKQLDEEGKLHLLEIDGDHMQVDLDWLKINIVDKYFI